MIKKLIIIIFMLIFCWGCFPKICPICKKDVNTYGWSGGNFMGEWDDYYACALSYIEGKCFDLAIWSLNEAIKLRYRDKWMARSYGMHFLDYFPHRELGICYFEIGQLEKSKQELEISLSQEKSDKALYYYDQVRKQMMIKEKQVANIPKILLHTPDKILTNKNAITLSGTIIDQQYSILSIFYGRINYLKFISIILCPEVIPGKVKLKICGYCMPHFTFSGITSGHKIILINFK